MCDSRAVTNGEKGRSAWPAPHDQPCYWPWGCHPVKTMMCSRNIFLNAWHENGMGRLILKLFFKQSQLERSNVIPLTNWSTWPSSLFIIILTISEKECNPSLPSSSNWQSNRSISSSLLSNTTTIPDFQADIDFDGKQALPLCLCKWFGGSRRFVVKHIWTCDTLTDPWSCPSWPCYALLLAEVGR